LRRLAVFSDGWTLAAAEEVCADERLPRADVLDLLAALVDKSLVVAERVGASTRFRMLTPIRQYAAEQLAGESQVQAAVTERHGRHYTRLAEQADIELWALREAGRARLDLESANLRSATDWACREHRSEALHLTSALRNYWRLRKRLAEGITATELALASTDSTPSPARALALATLGSLSFFKGDLVRAISASQEAIEMAGHVEAPRAHAHALVRLGATILMIDPGAAYPLLFQGRELAESVGDTEIRTGALTAVAMASCFQENYSAMEKAAAQALALAESIGDDTDVRWCLWAQSDRALVHGHLTEAKALTQRAMSMPDADTLSQSCTAALQSLCDTFGGHPDTGRARALAQLEEAQQDTTRIGVGVLLQALGFAELASGNWKTARVHFERSLHNESEGVGYIIWHAHEALMRCALAAGNPDQANVHAGEIIAIAEQLDSPRAVVVAQCGHARAAVLAGDIGSAEMIAHEALATAVDREWWLDTLTCLEILTAIAVHRGRHERAARLLAGIDSARASRGFVRTVPEQHLWDSLSAETIQALPASQLTSLQREGASMSLTDLADHARRGRGRRARPQQGWQSLTPVERQVTELAAQGLSNPQIAEQLFMARSTVKAHLAHVFAKLQIANRTELANKHSSQY
ncbi:LuxR C-terminal-related transcriptional regulator, partial [Streptomyces sp. NPDC086835]|uniref:LuxR C-terminal-related transcriptional regulator n=1 Tax=Streptomyces sp. NPDC086835 TaxID=3365761 RepID=UPI0038147D44